MNQRKFYPFLLFLISFLAVTFGAMDSVLTPAYLPDILESMKGANTEAVKDLAGSWINFSFLAGGTVGGIVLGLLADRAGRKITLTLSMILYGAGSAAAVLTTTWQWLAVTRFFVGMGVGAALVVSAVAVSETWKVRPGAIALGILSVAYPAGVIGSGFITSSVTDWKIAHLVGGLPLLMALPVYSIVKETMNRPAAISGQAPMQTSFSGTKLPGGILIYGTMLIGLWSAFAWLPTWVQQLIGDQSEKGQEQRGMAVMLLGMGGMAGGLVSGWLVNRWGAKRVQGICFLLCFVMSFLLFRLNDTFSVRVLAGSGLLGLLFGISQGVLNAWIPQLFHPRVRSTNTALCFHTGRAFTAVAVFFVGVWAVQLGGYGNAIFVFSLIYIIGFMALFLIKHKKETNASHHTSQ